MSGKEGHIRPHLKGCFNVHFINFQKTYEISKNIQYTYLIKLWDLNNLEYLNKNVHVLSILP